MQAVRAEDWDRVDDIASYNADMGYYMIRMYENMLPLELKCRIALFHYSDKGDFNPTIRKYVRKYQPNNPRGCKNLRKTKTTLLNPAPKRRLFKTLTNNATL